MKKLFLMMLAVFLIHENLQASAPLLLRLASLKAGHLNGMLEKYKQLCLKPGIDFVDVKIRGDHDGKMCQALQELRLKQSSPIRAIVYSCSGKVDQTIQFLNQLEALIVVDGNNRRKNTEEIILSRNKGKQFAVLCRVLLENEEVFATSYHPGAVRNLMREFDREWEKLDGARIKK